MISSGNYVGLFEGFLKSCLAFPNRSALDVDDVTYAYSELGQWISNLASTIKETSKEQALVGVYSRKDLTNYIGPLAILCCGKGYVPVNPKNPIQRNVKVIQSANVRTIIVGKDCYFSMEGLLETDGLKLTLILPECPSDMSFEARYPQHDFVWRESLVQGPATPLVTCSLPDSLAYVIFTSGSTGEPKGVPITHRNVKAFLANMKSRFNITEQDRFSQIPDISFDLSIMDIFYCWEVGGCLVSVPANATMAPGKFVKDKQISVWVSVPSTIDVMSRLSMTKVNAYPMMRYSLFCGEALSVASVKSWESACPNSTIVNLYGPTEASCAISYFIWDKHSSAAFCADGIVPMGKVFDDQEYCFVDEDLIFSSASGELCLRGTQVAKCYFGDPKLSEEKFIHQPISSAPWYRTGDIAMADKDGCLYFKGRSDHQVKLRGHRVELHEIDSAIKMVTGASLAISIGWPLGKGKIDEIVSFVLMDEASLMPSEKSIIEELKVYLPSYMVPRRIRFVKEVPYNVNGKVDRDRLILSVFGAELQQ